MPSYRLELEIGELRSGRAPQEVLGAAVASLGRHHVDATDIKLIGGIPSILVRLTVPASSENEEDAGAQMAADRVREAVLRVASTGQHRLLRRRPGSWLPVGSPDHARHSAEGLSGSS